MIIEEGKQAVNREIVSDAKEDKVDDVPSNTGCSVIRLPLKLREACKSAHPVTRIPISPLPSHYGIFPLPLRLNREMVGKYHLSQRRGMMGKSRFGGEGERNKAGWGSILLLTVFTPLVHGLYKRSK